MIGETPGPPVPQGESDSWVGIGINVNGAVFGGVGELHEPVTSEQIEQVALKLAQALGHLLMQEGIIGGGQPQEEGPSGPPEYGEA